VNVPVNYLPLSVSTSNGAPQRAIAARNASQSNDQNLWMSLGEGA
jgi:hypothetical protein